jgi:hypothetical protein
MGVLMRTAVVRTFVVTALVATAWVHAPAAEAAKGGHHPVARQAASAGVTVTDAGRTQVYSRTETDLASGEVSVFSVVAEYDNRGLLVHETRTDSVDGHVLGSTESAYTYGLAHRLSRVVIVEDPAGEGPVPPSTRVDTLTRNNRHLLFSIVSTIDDDSDGVIDRTTTETRGFDKRGARGLERGGRGRDGDDDVGHLRRPRQRPCVRHRRGRPVDPAVAGHP